MSAEKKHTDRDLVKARRDAYVSCLLGPHVRHSHTLSESIEAAKLVYPMPKVTRPRIVQDPHDFKVWRMSESGAAAVWARADSGPAFSSQLKWIVLLGDIIATAERIAMWEDLRANPTELVEDDGTDDGAET